MWAAILETPELIIAFYPMILIIELPLVLLMLIGVFRWYLKNQNSTLESAPSISIIIACYGEGKGIQKTIDTLVEQIYPGNIEILAVVDGAVQNNDTYLAAIESQSKYKVRKDRVVRIIPKWQRGGRVSTSNTGLYKAKNEIIINVDGDTSFDNDMVINIAKQFNEPTVIASGGALRVRNWNNNILTRMQALEYMMSMQGAKTGTQEFGLLNCISGAFGAFRRTQLQRIGGWDTHSAEDLDLTIRYKQYHSRYPKLKLGFTPHAIGHTEVPNTINQFFQQRLRWDGDLLFLYFRKHIKGMTPRLLGWPVFLYTLVYGVIQNILIPILVLLYTCYLVITYPLIVVFSSYLLIYFVYLSIITIKFSIYLVLISERKHLDIRLLGWIIVFPLFAFCARFATAFSMVNELIRRSHEESSMAPWWVLKRGKRF
ncbi:glycosyltransferase family 2 protein [Vibrio breoganii]|uniref:glycosyltransferase family 2 protein n=1 Tax=Vibrio breoganii TaxID=553239 RepID=UPI00037BE98D|nr:N-acetylglucosaminyltransferase [Vibrio breoganii ZF-29]PMO98140.1 N-acetylglucosaminyltransferase [Vibrio breoganii]